MGRTARGTIGRETVQLSAGEQLLEDEELSPVLSSGRSKIRLIENEPFVPQLGGLIWWKVEKEPSLDAILLVQCGYLGCVKSGRFFGKASLVEDRGRRLLNDVLPVIHNAPMAVYQSR